MSCSQLFQHRIISFLEFKTILVTSIIKQISTIAFGSVPVFVTAIIADSRNMIADGFRFTTAALLCTVGSVKSICTHCIGKTYRQNKLCMGNPVNVQGSLKKIRRQRCPRTQDVFKRSNVTHGKTENNFFFQEVIFPLIWVNSLHYI